MTSRLQGCVVSAPLAEEVDRFNKHVTRKDNRTGCFVEFFSRFDGLLVVMICLYYEGYERTRISNKWLVNCPLHTECHQYVRSCRPRFFRQSPPSVGAIPRY